MKAALPATSLFCLVLTTNLLAAPSFSIKDLGIAGRAAYPGSLNDWGVAVFTTFPEGSGGDITLPGGTYQYQNGGYSTLIGLGGPRDMVRDINNHGSAVGHSSVEDIYTTPTHAVIYKNGQAYILGINLTGGSYATALNDSEQVVGYASFAGEQHAFLYSGPDNVIDLGTPGFSSAAYDINEVGQVVGSSWGFGAEESFSQEAFLYSNGQMIDLGTLGGNMTSATAINNRGQIVGGSYTESRESHAFIYDPVNGMRDISPAGFNSGATDINDHGVVVGVVQALSYDAISQPMIYDEVNGVRLLEDLIPADSGWSRLLVATSINNRGQILGQGIFQGEPRIFLMTPLAAPEPSTLALVVLGAAICGNWRSSRSCSA